MATRCLWLGGISDHRSTWPKGAVVLHLATRCLCLEGRGGLTCCLTASQPAAIGKPTSHMQKCQPVRPQVGHIVGGGRTGGPTTLGPSLGSQHSHWFPWVVTLLSKARQVTQMMSAACYIPLALLTGTICSFVSASPNHIFLHQM